MSFLTDTDLGSLGFKSLGTNVRISSRASIFNAGRISIGSNVRIDDFSLLSAGDGGIEIGDHVHISVYVSVIGAGEIRIGSFAGLAARVAVYSSNDDYSGAALTGPTIPDAFRRVHTAPVHIGRHCVVGSGSVVLPGVTIGDGAIVGALSLIKRDCQEFGIYVGAPAQYRGDRKRDVLLLEDELQEATLRSRAK